MPTRPGRRRLAAAAALVAATLALLAGPAAAHPDHTIQVSATTGLKAGDVVKVSAPAGSYSGVSSVFIGQCNIDPAIPPTGGGCAIDNGKFGAVNADGSVSEVEVTIKTGQIGGDPLAQCPPTAAQQAAGIPCVIVVSSLDKQHSGRVPLTFEGQDAGPAPTTTTTAPAGGATTTSTTAKATAGGGATTTTTAAPQVLGTTESRTGTSGGSLARTGPTTLTWALGAAGLGLVDLGYLAWSATRPGRRRREG